MGLARFALGAMLVGICAWTAQATPVGYSLLDEAGWKITGPSAAEVSVYVDDVGIDQTGQKFVVLEISKKFFPGISSIVLDFTQIADDADTATRIFIADETVTNLTGVTWTDYHWVLQDHGVASFNQELTDGFSVAPFEQAQWIVNEQSEELSVWDGEVGPGGVFFPGHVTGNLVIDVDSSGTWPASFSFKQLPTVPEPGSLALLLVGAARALRRRR